VNSPGTALTSRSFSGEKPANPAFCFGICKNNRNINKICFDIKTNIEQNKINQLL